MRTARPTSRLVPCVALVMLLVPGVGARATPPVTSAEFRDWFVGFSEARLRIPAEVQSASRRFRYVFVAGFLNERMPGYFAQNVRELRAMGIPKGAIHVVAPSSHKTFEENREAIGDAFREVAAEGPERLVLIAHSRGAGDTLAFALAEPAFVRDRVEALFLVQGPFGGSGVADYVVGDGEPLDVRMPPVGRAVVRLLGRLEAWALGRGRHGGLARLTRPAAREFWEETLGRHAEAIPVVGPKTFFVTSEAVPSRLRLLSRALGRYLTTYYGPNDGLVLLEDQELPGFGTVLGPLRAGHADLTRTFLATKARRKVRKALVRSIIMAVCGREEDASLVRRERVFGEGNTPALQGAVRDGSSNARASRDIAGDTPRRGRRWRRG